MGIACALLSVFVVLRHWVFIGEGIAHAGFGGAGTAWIASLIFPWAFLKTSFGVYAVAIVFCFAMALGIGYVTRRRQVHTDTAIGIFLVASLAWGFIASGIYKAALGAEPPELSEYLFGQMRLLPPEYVIGTTVIALTVVAVVIALGKEILYYAFDPNLAEVSGVRVGFVHYVLVTLLTLMVILGMRMMGSVLVTALLVLPGATALLISRRLQRVIAVAIVVGLLGAIAGPLINCRWAFIPEGPAIVLALVTQFVIAYLGRRIVRRS